jgi:hypothetical protein
MGVKLYQVDFLYIQLVHKVHLLKNFKKKNNKLIFFFVKRNGKINKKFFL